jgi:aspartate ammonia-lyase
VFSCIPEDDENGALKHARKIFIQNILIVNIKLKVLPLHKQILLLINSQHVSVQKGQHQVIVEEYKNGDGTHMNYNASITFLLVKIASDPT